MDNRHIDGVIDNKIKLVQRKNIDVSREMRGAIIPFAQQEMVYRFMEGVDPFYRRYLEGKITKLCEENAQAIVDNFVSGSKKKKEEIVEKITDLIVTNLKEFFEGSKKYTREHFADPILDMIIMLPKEEIANLAESLVSLTSLKRRISLDRETVGGPIDVAVISKGDGFVWIKRKHYFRPELNPYFFENYFRTSSVRKPQRRGTSGTKKK